MSNKKINLREKRKQFLKETIEHFNINNRGMESGLCCYTAGCAIGIHLDENLCKELDEMAWPSVFNITVFEKLPNNLKILGQGFLCDVQSLHDNKYNWNETGLSSVGIRCVKSILSYYGLKLKI